MQMMPHPAGHSSTTKSHTTTTTNPPVIRWIEPKSKTSKLLLLGLCLRIRLTDVTPISFQFQVNRPSVHVIKQIETRGRKWTFLRPTFSLTWNCYAIIAECAKRGPRRYTVIGFYNSSTLSSYTYIGSTIIIVKKNSFFFLLYMVVGGKGPAVLIYI